MVLEDILGFFRKQLDASTIEECIKKANDTVSLENCGGDPGRYNVAFQGELINYLMEAVESARRDTVLL